MDILKFKSVVRRNLLILFFTNPEKKYYVRQLARMIGQPASNVSTEMKNLRKTGLFKTEKLGNLLFYQVNQFHPLYNEIKSIIRKTIGAVGGLKEVLHPVPGIICAFIFGSFAREEEDKTSDIDLLVIGDVDSDVLSEAIRQQEKVLQREINHHLYSPEDWQNQVISDNSFIINIREKPRIILIGEDSCLI